VPNFQELLNLVDEKVSTEDRMMLEEEFTVEDIKHALFQMHPSKSPGVDGFTAGFYQRHWNLLGGELCMTVLGFLNGGVLPDKINNTSITLIPKVRHPQSIK
jgi:hypothetical protein